MNDILLILSCIGTTLILQQGQPLRPIREWVCNKSDIIYDLFSCSLCLGFWVGLLYIPFSDHGWKMAFVGAAASFIADSFIKACQSIASRSD